MLSVKRHRRHSLRAHTSGKSAARQQSHVNARAGFSCPKPQAGADSAPSPREYKNLPARRFPALQYSNSASRENQNLLGAEYSKTFKEQQRYEKQTKMCRTYLIPCPLCDTHTIQPYFCAELAARRTAHTTTTADPKPTRADCPLHIPSAPPSRTTTFCQPPMVQACARHRCGRCGFLFWYGVEEEDDGGKEDLGYEEREGRREEGVRREMRREWKGKRGDRVEPA